MGRIDGAVLREFVTALLVAKGSEPAEAETEEARAEAAKEESAMNERRQNHCAEILEKKLADVPEEEREETRQAVLADPAGRTQRQKDLLEAYPMVKPVNFISGLLVEYDGAAHQRFEKEKQKVAAIRAKKPPLRMIVATTEPKGKLPVSRIFFRGNPESPRGEVAPGELIALSRAAGEVIVPEAPGGGGKSSGRRLAYARHLTSGAHPLTARVFVNRVWAHHFGRGLVATPGDFGIAGEQPSHPLLLDWLARDFVAEKLAGVDVSTDCVDFAEACLRRRAEDRALPDLLLAGPWLAGLDLEGCCVTLAPFLASLRSAAAARPPPAPPARQSSTFAADLSLIQTLDASSDDDDEATVEG